MERLLSKITVKVGKFALRRLFGLQLEPPSEQELDQHIELEISAAEAAAGGEEKVTHKRGNKTQKLIVKIPPGIKTGTQIKLKGMGLAEDKKQGDLYLHVKVKD
jgi:DnaJ-class molecular chaperone